MSAMKYIFILGGVVSGTGKGVLSGSIGFNLTSHNQKVRFIKIDPYLNLNAGSLSPSEHGEVFVLDDGSETDLDVGHYQRFVGNDVSVDSITIGQCLYHLLQRNKETKSLGQTITMRPHLFNEILRRILDFNTKEYDVTIIEIGGTVTDDFLDIIVEVLSYLKQNFSCITCLVAPLIFQEKTPSLNEKTKPLQNAIDSLKKIGLQPNLLFIRHPKKYVLSNFIKEKIILSSNLQLMKICSLPNLNNIMHLPIELQKQKIDLFILNYLNIKPKLEENLKLKELKHILDSKNKSNSDITVAICGKYTTNDAYLSIIQALRTSALLNKTKINIKIFSDYKYKDICIDAMIVPGGFGERLFEYKVDCVRYARENKIPFLGICMGFQAVLVEYYRNILGIINANTEEVLLKNITPVITKISSEYIGSFDINLVKGSQIYDIYQQQTSISERFRNTFIFNLKNKKQLENEKVFTNYLDDKVLVIFGLIDHPCFIATQYHPEFKSTYLKGHPLFNHIIKVATQLSSCNKI